MTPFQTIVVLIVFLRLTCSSNTTQMHETNDESYRDMAFTNHVSYRLILPVNVKDITIKTKTVANNIHCAFACVETSWCSSANFKLIPNSRNLHKCELISSDGYAGKYQGALKQDGGYIHMNKVLRDPCEKNPCVNGGLCTVLNNRPEYRCQCKEGYEGERCQNGKELIGLQTSVILRYYGNSSYFKTLSSYLSPVLQNSSASRWVRCWHAAINGWDVTTTFHPQCDNRGPTVTIVRVANYVFGGYTDASWHGRQTHSGSCTSFLYSLYNTNGYQPLKMSIIVSSRNCAIYGRKDYGPTFGAGYDLFISNKATSNKKSYSFFSTYQPIQGCDRTRHCSVLAGSGFFTPSDVEVFYERTSSFGIDKIKKKTNKQTNEVFRCV